MKMIICKFFSSCMLIKAHVQGNQSFRPLASLPDVNWLNVNFPGVTVCSAGLKLQRQNKGLFFFLLKMLINRARKTSLGIM